MNGVDLLLYNGPIISVDDNNNIYDWLCVHNGRILDIGTNEGYIKYMGTAKEVINLMGRTVLPGFYDSHINLVLSGQNTYGVDLSNVKNLGEIFHIVRETAKKTPSGQLIRGTGIFESNLDEKRFPTRQELDLCAPDNPVWINSIEYHTSSVNSLMLHRINLPFNLEGISRDKNNIPDGRLKDKANSFLRNSMFGKISDEARKDGSDIVIKKAIENGVTSFTTFEGSFVSHENHAKYVLENMNTFPIDVEMFYQTVNVSKAKEKGIKRVGGIFLDGTFSSRTAAISFGYEDEKNSNGVLYFSQEDINDFVLKAHMAGMQITAHCIGDVAIEQLIIAYEYAQSKYPRNDHRHRIEHCELFRDDLIERARKLNLVIAMQPTCEYYWGGPGKMYSERLGERRKNTNPFRRIIDRGLIIAGSSDYDIMPMNPLFGIHMAVNHPTAEFRTSVMEAVRMYTINGAYAVFEEKEKGSLEIGKKGDIVILDRNPLEVKNDEIINIKVMANIKEGNILLMR